MPITDYRSDRLTSAVRLMIGRRVVGLAVVVSEIEEALITDLARSEMRVVFSGVDTLGAAFTNVKVNCRKGMEKVLTYLSALGHRRMAFVGHHAALESINARAAAFLEGVARFGSKFESLTFTDSDGIGGGRQTARDILSSGFQPTSGSRTANRFCLRCARADGNKGAGRYKELVQSAASVVIASKTADSIAKSAKLGIVPYGKGEVVIRRSGAATSVSVTKHRFKAAPVNSRLVVKDGVLRVKLDERLEDGSVVEWMELEFYQGERMQISSPSTISPTSRSRSRLEPVT